MSTRQNQRGVSLVEALVALVVMSVGMLGIASLYVTSLQTSRSALTRTQAVNIVNDMADRIRANSRGRAAYNTADFKASDSVANCSGDSTCSPTELAKSDVSAWMAFFSPPTVASSPTFTTDAVGKVQYVEGTGGEADQYTISLEWGKVGAAYENKYVVSLRLIPVNS